MNFGGGSLSDSVAFSVTLAPDERCRSSYRALRELRVAVFHDSFAGLSPLSVTPSDRVHTFNELCDKALIRQSELIRYAGRESVALGGHTVAELWLQAREILGLAPGSAASQGGSGVLILRKLGIGHSSPKGWVLPAAVLSSWREAILMAASESLLPQTRGGGVRAALLESTELFRVAASVELEHWWRSTRCGCSHGHDWLATFAGWLEVLVQGEGGYR